MLKQATRTFYYVCAGMLSLRSALLRSPAATVRGYVRQFCSTPAVDHLEVTVDGKAVSVPKDYTVLQACEAAGATVPRFCYHDRLSIAGNCRMCLVEIEKAPKPVASCAMPLMPGMNIKTNTPLVDKARQGVVEFLLVNHPLDCPICDQGGECDLQDQTLKYGRLRSRSFELRRGVEDKYIGPVVKTVMTRCIHCTRCVRFAEEIAGTEDLGATGRGNTMEIGTYVDKVFDSELSGNVVDLCPVGALTSKPFAFRARPWELERVETIDCHDSLGTNITIDYVGMDIMRVLPRLNEDINEEWLGDKSRLAYDGLKKQRLEHPMVRGKDGKFEKLLWHEALEEVERRLAGVDGRDIKGYAGDLVDAEAMISFKDLLNRLGCDFVDCRQDGSHVPADLRGDYTLASTIAGVDQADAVVLVGTNPRMEAALLNARIRKGFVQNGIEITSIGPKFTTTYPVTHLGNDLSLLNSSSLKAALGDAERPLVLVGVAAFQTADDASFTAQALAELRSAFPALSNGEWNGVNVLQLSAGRTAGMDLGLVPGVSGSAQKDAPAKVVFLLGADEVPDEMIPKDAFVIYQVCLWVV